MKKLMKIVIISGLALGGFLGADGSKDTHKIVMEATETGCEGKTGACRVF